MATTIYIRILHGHTFPNGVFQIGKYPNMHSHNLIYSGIGGGHNTYICTRFIVWQQDGEIFNKPQLMKSFWYINMR